MATHDARSSDGFLSFFRSYTKTWIHAVATAGLTAFGTLTIVHRGFLFLALASYVVPPIVLYFWEASVDRPAETASTDRAAGTAGENRGVEVETETGTGSETAAETEPGTDTGMRTESDTETRSESDAETSTGPATGTAPPERADTEDIGATRDPADSGDTVSGHEGRGAGTGRADESAAGEASASEDQRSVGWQPVDVPTETTLRDVTVTETGAVYAVGDGGRVLSASGADSDGDAIEGEWSVILEDGPAAAGADLSGVDATAGGEAVWIAGDSGAVGRLEGETGLHTDHTAPAGITDNWLGVAVGGAGGDETVLLINGSGAVLRGRYRDGAVSWDDPVKPGSGSSMSGIALADDSVGYCCDTNDGVFETTDGGESFDRVGLGGAGGTLENLATLGRGDCFVSADDGVVHRYGGSTWTPERVGEEAICGVARREGETIACDADGVIYERTVAADWDQVDTRASEPLTAVSIDADGDRAVAVGEDGAVVERRRY